MKINSIGRLAFLCLLGAAACMLSVSCGDDGIIGETAYTFSGTITDSATGAALESVQVTTASDTTSSSGFYTDSTGFYQGVTFAGQIKPYTP